MFLIMSAAYVDQELQSEFGKIPPSFLPLGNRRLYQHQVKLAPKGSKVYLSLPESYCVSSTDQHLLNQLNVTVIKLTDGISLGASLVAAITLSEHHYNDPLRILYGDTLLTDVPQDDDFVCISEVEDYYDWAIVVENEDKWLQQANGKIDNNTQNVVCGYFTFSDARELMRSVIQCNWQFLDGVNQYKKSKNLKAIFTKNWLDFGHVNTYYSSKSDFTTQRSFNELIVTADWIEKSSEKNSKIAAEANWFSVLPFSLRGYIPQYLGSKYFEKTISYRLEYLQNTALNELYVFSELPVHIWKKIINKSVGFLAECYKEKPQESLSEVNTLEELFGKKTDSRLLKYCSENSIDLDEMWTFNQELTISLRMMLEDSKKYLPREDGFSVSILHGDFCFSNILYDFRSNRIKTIDPRGITPNGNISIWGDIRYDIAKLSHSIIGMYDWIIAGHHQVAINQREILFSIEIDERKKEIQNFFMTLIKREFGISAVSLMAMQIQLFLSMLPLHSDDENRQDALFANAFRIYQLMLRYNK